MHTTYTAILLTIDKDTGLTVDINEEKVTISKLDEDNGYHRINFVNSLAKHLPNNVTHNNFSKDLSGWTYNDPNLPIQWKIITIFENEFPTQ